MKRREFLIGGFVAAGTLMLAGCQRFGAAEHPYELAPENVLPADIAKAPDEVREAYRFAIRFATFLVIAVVDLKDTRATRRVT